MSDESVKNVVMAIADISGYTKFMVSTGIEIKHSQYIISQLIESIISQVKIPLELSKIEGDAVFLYALKESEDFQYEEVKKTLGAKLIRFFDVFHNKIEEIRQNNPCPCGACKNIHSLKLKIVAHSGEALFYQIDQFKELSGKDVILIHRLLKNSISNDEYILMTDTAFSDIEFPNDIEVQEGIEHYEHLGEIKTLTYCHGE